MTIRNKYNTKKENWQKEKENERERSEERRKLGRNKDDKDNK